MWADESHVFAIDLNPVGGDYMSGEGLPPAPPGPTSRTWGHDSVGVSQAAARWYLAEGCTASDFETWVLVQNPNDVPDPIEITYMTASGLVHGPKETLPPNSRKTYNVSLTVPGAWDVSTMVDAGQPVIAERAMYCDPK